MALEPRLTMNIAMNQTLCATRLGIPTGTTRPLRKSDDRAISIMSIESRVI